MGALLAALGVAQGVSRMIEANQDSQRQKGIIGRAYDIAAARQKIQQGDVQQTEGGRLASRGLTGGGDVRTLGPASLTTPSVGGAHTLGGQQTLDLSREQSLETQDLQAQRSTDLSNVKASRNAAEISAGADAIASGFKGYQASQTLTPRGAVAPKPSISGVDNPASDNLHTVAWGGIDPVDPLHGGGAFTGGFNTYAAGAAGAAG